MIEHQVGIGGEYRAVVKRDGETVLDTGYFDNLILDNFFEGIDGYWYDNIVSIHVGTGTTPPAASQTELVNRIAYRSAGSADLAATDDGPTILVGREYIATFPIGAVVGNISEVGASFTNNAITVHTRALIKDIGGNPTTIPVTATDQLIIYYRHWISYSKQDAVDVVDVAGVPTTVTMQASALNKLAFKYSDTVRLIGAYENVVLNGAGLDPTTSGASTNAGGSTSKISNGVVEHTVTLSTSTANFPTGIGGLSATSIGNSGFGYSVSFNPKIPKTSNDLLILKFRKTFSRL